MSDKHGDGASLSALAGSGTPVFATEEEAQKFRNDYSAEMEPILKEQRKARALSEFDARYPMRRELKRIELAEKWERIAASWMQVARDRNEDAPDVANRAQARADIYLDCAEDLKENA